MKTKKNIFNKLIKRINSDWCLFHDYRTNKHIVVFESDDWGSIRMPKRKGWEALLKLGYAVDKRPYERFDTLESAGDLEALFDVLSKYKDCNGNHPVITANMLMVNPDFEKIEKAGFQEYYYERIAATYERYFGNAKVLELMRQGVNEGLFMPQNHGREHFNVAQWMKGLQNQNEDLMIAFQHGMCGIAPKANPERGNQLQIALRASSEEEQAEINRIVTEGLHEFEEFWGFKSKTFVAPCYCWSEDTEKTLADNGVKLIQTDRTSKPSFRAPSRSFYAGQYNRFGQVYNIRNCSFEPSTNGGGASVDAIMKQIDKVFSQRKLAVFSTHRINYVSGIDERNRSNTLRVFDKFLSCLLQKYPDTVFLSSDKLVNLFLNNDYQ